MKPYLIQYLSSENVHSHPTGPSGEQKRLNMLKMSLPTACGGTLAHIEEKCALSRLHANFARKERTAHLTPSVSCG